LTPQLVHDRAADTRPRVLLERGAACRVETIDRLDESDQPATDQIVELTVRRKLAHLL
jgi:hypothetical protein